LLYSLSNQSRCWQRFSTKVISLLKNGTPKLDLTLLDQIEALKNRRQSETYSAAEDSEWQKTNSANFRRAFHSVTLARTDAEITISGRFFSRCCDAHITQQLLLRIPERFPIDIHSEGTLVSLAMSDGFAKGATDSHFRL
jgi:hypothetical protein